MQRAKVTVFLLMISATAAITLAPGWGWGQTAGWQRDCNAATEAHPSLAQDDSEKRILLVLKEIEGPIVDEVHGRLLRILVESTGAKNVVEIGTGPGYSALWLCLGLKATGGKLITHEIQHRRVLEASANFKRAGVQDMVTMVVGNAHRTISQLKEPIDILFLDAEGGNLDYFNQLLPLVRPGGLILADNMSKPRPDPRFIKAITSSPNLETIFLNMRAQGISVTLKKK